MFHLGVNHQSELSHSASGGVYQHWCKIPVKKRRHRPQTASPSPELWRDAVPCNLPSAGARSAVLPAFLCLPTSTHESFSHSCSGWREMSPIWPSVLCVCVCVCVFLLLATWESAFTVRVTSGYTSAKREEDAQHFLRPACDRFSLSARVSFPGGTTLDTENYNLTGLWSTACRRCWAHVLRHAGWVQLPGHWLVISLLLVNYACDSVEDNHLERWDNPDCFKWTLSSTHAHVRSLSQPALRMRRPDHVLRSSFCTSHKHDDFKSKKKKKGVVVEKRSSFPRCLKEALA